MMKKIRSIGCLAGFIALVITSCKMNKTAADEAVVQMDTINVKPKERPVYRSAETRLEDIVHTKLELSFNWDSSFVNGVAELQIKPYFYPLSSVKLDARGFQLLEVVELKNGKSEKRKYDYDNKEIHIPLDREITSNDTITLRIKYVAMPDKLDVKGSSAITQDKGMYFINPREEEEGKARQLWTQGETEANSGWFPTVDSPNEKFTHDIYVTIEEDHTSISNGLKMFSVDNGDGTKTEYWKMDQPHSAYLVMLAVGPFAKYEDHWGEMEVNYFLDSAYAPYATDIFGNTPEMLTFYSEYLGVKYPWQKYDQVIVEDFVSGAMENTTAVIHGSFVQRTRRELIDQNFETVIAHELFHHWFGDLVTCESWSNLTLNEGFATYGEHLWQEYKYGADEAAFHLHNDLRNYLSEASRTQKDLIRFHYDDREEMFDTHSYSKGGRILHMLRNEVGENAFRKSLKKYLTDYAYKNVEVHDLRLTFEAVTGRDLNWFFNQWFLASGHPVLRVEHAYIDSTKTLELSVEQTQDLTKTPLYRLPVEIEIGTDNGPVRKQIVIDKERQVFHFEFPAKPTHVNFDRDKILVVDKKQEQTTAEWIAQFKEDANFLSQDEAMNELEKADTNEVFEVFIEAALDSFWVTRANAYSYLAGYVKNHSNEKVRKMLLDAISEDEHWRVRCIAMNALSDIKDELALTIYPKQLDDSSYSVVGTAFKCIAAQDEEEARKLLPRMLEEDNSDIRIVISGYISKHGTEADNEFYVKRIGLAKGFEKYRMIDNYGDYLKSMPEKMTEDAIPLLNDVYTDEDAPSWIQRMALSVIMDLYEHDKEMLKEVEKDLAKAEKGSADHLSLSEQKDQLTANIQLMEPIVSAAEAKEKSPH